MTDGNLYRQRFHPLPWQQCPRCNWRGPEYDFVSRYCQPCAAIIIENLDALTIRDIWRAVDRMKAAHDE